MEEQNNLVSEYKCNVMPDDDIKELIHTVEQQISASHMQMGEPKIIIYENGKKELIIPINNSSMENIRTR